MVFRIKALKPSLKEKKRYVVFEVLSKTRVGFKDTRDAILDAVHRFLGSSGAAKLGLVFFEDRWKDQKGIVKVNLKHVEQLKASFCFAGKINGQEVICRSVGASGILKKAMNRYIA